jgi:hypothetical protein
LAQGQKIEELYKSNVEMDFEITSIEAKEHRLGLTVYDEKRKKEKEEKATEVKEDKEDEKEAKKEKKSKKAKEDKE